MTSAVLGSAAMRSKCLMANLPGRVDPEGAVELERSVYRWKFYDYPLDVGGKEYDLAV
jgi:hypothetical protein